MSNEVFKDLDARIKTFNRDNKKSFKKDYSKKPDSQKQPPSGSINEMTVKFRDSVAEMFIQCISDDAKQEQWHSGWATYMETPVNGITNVRYRGINRLYLMMLMMRNGWTDNRFMTFRQAEKAHYTIKKGSKSVLVEYWFPYDFTNEKTLTWDEYNEMTSKTEDGEESPKIGLTAKYFHVFHASQINGIPELKQQPVETIEPNLLISRISKEMGVPILHDGKNNAYYQLDTDDIHLPPLNAFLSAYDYAWAALHELGHATGSPTRLNRNQAGNFGSEEYAKEELIAEITSTFMSPQLGPTAMCRDYGNHRAYVQSWIKAIKDDARHKVLFDAIKEAEKASDYMQSFLKKEVEQNGQ